MCRTSRRQVRGSAPRRASRGSARALRVLAWAGIVSTVACRSPLSTRKDAGPGMDAVDDVPQGLDVSLQDPAKADLSANDLTGFRIPKGFRIANRTNRVAYVDANGPINGETLA